MLEERAEEAKKEEDEEDLQILIHIKRRQVIRYTLRQPRHFAPPFSPSHALSRLPSILSVFHMVLGLVCNISSHPCGG